jgi:hypothetical protein
MKRLLTVALFFLPLFSFGQRYDYYHDIEYNRYQIADNHVSKIEEYIVSYKSMDDSVPYTDSFLIRRFLFDDKGREIKREENARFGGGPHIIFLTRYGDSPEHWNDTVVTTKITEHYAVETGAIWDGPPAYAVQHYSNDYLISTDLYKDDNEVGIDSLIYNTHHFVMGREIVEDGKLKVKFIVKYYDEKGNQIPDTLAIPAPPKIVPIDRLRFYRRHYETKTQDVSRLPLLIPYEVTRSIDSKNWTMDIQNDSLLDNRIEQLTKVAVIDSVIVLYSPKAFWHSTDEYKTWLVIDTRTGKDTLFNKSAEFKTYMKSIGKSNIQFYKIDNVYGDFVMEETLPWADIPKRKQLW